MPDDSPADDLVIAQARRLDPDEARVLRAIYEASFPPAEREDFSHIEAGAASGRLRLSVARLAGEPVGLAVAAPLNALPVLYLEYMAVDGNLRSQGIGGRLLGHVVTGARAAGGIEALAFEVESVEHGPPAEAAIRRRRISFYRRHGAQIIGCAPAYRAPALDGAGVIHFTLMWLPIWPESPPPRGERLQTLVHTLLTESYGLPADHALVQAVIDDLVC